MARSRRIAPAMFVLATAVAVWRSGPAGLALLLPAIPAALRPDPDLRPSYAIGLPGLPDGPPVKSRLPERLYSAVGVGGGLLALVVASVGVPQIVLFVLAVLLLALYVVAADALVRYLTGNRKLERALRAHAPTIGMGYAGRTGGSWQLRMWEPYLLRSGERCVIINLHQKYVERILSGQPPLRSPFVQLGSRGTAHLGRVLVPSLRTLYYVQNAGANAGFLKHRRITHVWLNHGDSDKPAAFHPRHADYDRLVVSGQAGIDRYARHGIVIPPEKFVLVGRPQASDIQPARGPVADQAPQKVLYAPTWQGISPDVDFSSLSRGPDIVRGLLSRDVTIVFRPHPLSYNKRKYRTTVRAIGRMLAADKKAAGREHVWGKQADKVWTVADCANHVDALISDVSSVVSDFLQSEKPYAMTAMQESVEDFRRQHPVARGGYVLLGDLSNLDSVLDDLLRTDPLASARSELKRYVLGDFTGSESAEAFAAFVRELAGGAAPVATSSRVRVVTAR
jgi:CDP-Glycerol:Poly(glycerophosphate) glycerophosphotransferase